MTMASRNYLPASLPPHQHSSSRRVPVSTSLPQTSWLSEATEFNPPTPAPTYLGLGISVPGADLLSSSSLSEMGQPSRTVQRVRSRDYLLSTSPTSASGARTRHTPSPIPSPSPSHTLHPSRSFTTSTSLHKTSGMSSDASGHLDMKRLMSKPARQTPSGSVSLPSDSERSGDASSSRIMASRRPSNGAASHPPLSKSANVSREKVSLYVKTTGLRSSSVPRDAHSSPERRPLTVNEGQASKPPRNVLRRRASARSNPSAPPSTHSRLPTEELRPPPRATSMTQPRSSPRDDMRLAAYTSRPSTSPAVRPNTSPRIKSNSSPVPKSHVPSGLTPAGAVALAYKQQEQRREELAETASFNDAFRPPSAQPSPSLFNQKPPSTFLNDEEETGGGPYYTVFGGASGRLVAVGGPDDHDLQFDQYSPRGNATAHTKSASHSRSLSRKVSGSLKRVTGSMKRERELRELPTIPSDDGKSSNAPRPGHSGKNPSISKVGRKPLVLDMSVQERGTAQEPVAKNITSPLEEGPLSRASKAKPKDEELSPGGKWWKLMKRISTGGLRDKYQQDEAPPPVPALPRDITRTPARTTMDVSSRDPDGMDVNENGVLLRRFMQSRASLSGVRPTLATPSKASSGSSRPSTAQPQRPSTANTTKSQSRASISGHRPSTATRSSSPSSQLTSGFFNHPNRTPSARSSFSSFGEEVPRIPKNVGQHIVAPSELSRMTKSSEVPSSSTRLKRSRTQSRSQTAPTETTCIKNVSSQEDRNLLSLPLPPRRGVPSPLSPTFDVEDTINSLMPPQHQGPLPLTEFGMVEPPPRPKRSSRRTAVPSTVDIPTRSQSLSATSPQPPHSPPTVRVDVDLMRRPSTGALSDASTAKPISASSSNSPSSGPSSSTSPSSASQKRSPLTFRELESPRHRLTEKEKADKWDDLLERSARAGGTLHIGETHLLSDQADVVADSASYRGYDSDR